MKSNQIMGCRVPPVILLLLVITLFPACHKKNKDNPFGNARIATILYTHGGEIDHMRIAYDKFNNVDSIVVIGDGTAMGHYSLKTFTYFGSNYNVADEQNNIFAVQTNAAGLITKILIPDTMIMTYSGSQLTELDYKTQTSSYPYYAVTREYFTWQGGNITAYGNASLTYDYSHAGQPGDALRVDDFLAYGRSYLRTSSLPVKITNGVNGEGWQYSYQFDGGGRITQFTKSLLQGNSVVDSMIYQYTYY